MEFFQNADSQDILHPDNFPSANQSNTATFLHPQTCSSSARKTSPNLDHAPRQDGAHGTASCIAQSISYFALVPVPRYASDGNRSGCDTADKGNCIQRPNGRGLLVKSMDLEARKNQESYRDRLEPNKYRE